MPKRTSIIPKAPCARILTDSGAKRVSADAAAALSDKLAETAAEIAEQAVRIAKHSGRKTIHEGDVKLAARR